MIMNILGLQTYFKNHLTLHNLEKINLIRKQLEVTRDHLGWRKELLILSPKMTSSILTQAHLINTNSLLEKIWNHTHGQDHLLREVEGRSIEFQLVERQLCQKLLFKHLLLA